MCAYFSKAEDDTSKAIKQAAKESLVENKSDQNQMKSVANTYATKRRCFVQKKRNLLMPKFWLCRIFPRIISLNTNLSKKPRLMNSQITALTYLSVTYWTSM